VTISLPQQLRFDANGLIPVVAQDRRSGDLLMVAYANAEALRLTTETGLLHLWSRSRQALWKKGETSGNRLRVRDVRADCDRDALLVSVDPEGPACHTGARTCFGEESPSAAGMLEELRRVIASRRAASPDSSYTARLLGKGIDQALKKIGEESAELVIAAKAESQARVAEESADLLFHLLLVLELRGVAVADVMDVLRRRRAES
jgi:phosphoribosyl-ATP pyrophosphohydrolase/phosphoribosyl-AMP cyclohydrolase